MIGPLSFRFHRYTAGFAGVLMCAIFTAAVRRNETSNAFVVKIVGQTVAPIEGKQRTADSVTEFRYTWSRIGQERTLSFDEFRLRVKIDGSEVVNTLMCRAKRVTVERGEVFEVPFEVAAPHIKKVLADSFGSPICKVMVDDNGKPITRKMVARDGAKLILEHGLVANALLFHPPFLTKQNEWEFESEISLGNGRFATGTLHYLKLARSSKGQIVKVTGTLTNSEPTEGITETRFVVTGDQVFDSTVNEWVSGSLLIDCEFEPEKPKTPSAIVKGKLSVNFERLSDTR